MFKDTFLSDSDGFIIDGEIKNKVFEDYSSLNNSIINEGFKIDNQEREYKSNTSSLENNIIDSKKGSSEQNNQLKQQKQDNIHNALHYIVNDNSRNESESYYNELKEYLGIVQSVDYSNNHFNVLFTDDSKKRNFSIAYN